MKPTMTRFRRTHTAHSRTELLKALRLTLWAAPLAMAFIGVAFTVIEHFRHQTDPLSPWPTALGLLVLGLVGPASRGWI